MCAVLYVCSVCVSGRPESESSRVASRSSWGRVEHAEQQRIKSLENTKLSARLQQAAAKAAKETQNKQQGRQPILQQEEKVPSECVNQVKKHLQPSWQRAEQSENPRSNNNCDEYILIRKDRLATSLQTDADDTQDGIARG